MSKNATSVAFKMEIKDTDVTQNYAYGKKIYFMPKELESELPRIFRAAIVHRHPETYQEDMFKRFVGLSKISFRRMHCTPQDRGGETALATKVLLDPPSGKVTRNDFTNQAREKFKSQYGQYVSVIPLLVSQRKNSKGPTSVAFQLLPENMRNKVNLIGAPYYSRLKHMENTHAYLIYKGQVHKPMCTACAFVTLGISGDCHPMDKICLERMSIPGVSLAGEVNKLTEQRIQQIEGECNDDVLRESTECSGISDEVEIPRSPAGE